MAIRKSRELSEVLGSPEDITIGEFVRHCQGRKVVSESSGEELGGTALHSSRYHLLPCDLRLPPTTSLAPVLDALLSPSLPTLLLCECVLVYISPESSAALFEWFVNRFAAARDGSVLGTIVYEMFGLQDAFGQVMLHNLRVCLCRFLRCRCLHSSAISHVSHGMYPCPVRSRTPRSIPSVNALPVTSSHSPMHWH